VIQIEREHPEYAERRSVWSMYRDLYAGGEQLKRNAASYLTQRWKEPPEVYTERLNSVFYENYIGSIVDWYAATVFRREPLLTFDGVNDDGKRFFYDFTADCDLRGTDLTDFLRARLIDAMVQGSSRPARNLAWRPRRMRSAMSVRSYSATAPRIRCTPASTTWETCTAKNRWSVAWTSSSTFTRCGMAKFRSTKTTSRS